ncbi:hypothetical protein BT96DRAFT_1060241, partial [Gymnopus androsaceus JB14]
IGRVISAATATAISVGNLPLAVEWLDEGRSIIWGQILQLRSPVHDLYHQYPDIAKELKMVAQALESAGTLTKKSFETIGSEKKQATVEEDAQKHHRMAIRYEELIQHIRNLDGFASFLKPKKLSELGSAAAQGPIIIVNVHESRCDALVLSHSGGLTLVHEYAEDTVPHITWCPTGPLTLLPLHAAGIYGSPTENNINISDFAVSSYTTTLRALIGSVSKVKQHLYKIPTILIVSQPNTPGLPPLPGTVEEVKIIQKYTLSKYTCHLDHDVATADAVMHAMSKYDIIHFACHGIQDIQDPLDSAFALYDQKLKLKALMNLSLNNVQLAVLSACQTATGDENLPEEAVHLAAGMLSVGYPSVIATLWSIGDKEAPLIADKLYANLLETHGSYSKGNGKVSPAYALHAATKSLRKEVGDMNFVKWVPFIHLGI